jgi:hypothetical protein
MYFWVEVENFLKKNLIVQKKDKLKNKYLGNINAKCYKNNLYEAYEMHYILPFVPK